MSKHVALEDPIERADRLIKELTDVDWRSGGLHRSGSPIRLLNIGRKH